MPYPAHYPAEKRRPAPTEGLTADHHTATSLDPSLWLDASTELPDADETVLIHAPADDEPVWLGYHDGERWLTVDNTPLFHAVTHWQPLPDPP